MTQRESTEKATHRDHFSIWKPFFSLPTIFTSHHIYDPRSKEVMAVSNVGVLI